MFTGSVNCQEDSRLLDKHFPEVSDRLPTGAV